MTPENRKPLPDDVNIHAWNAGDIMVALSEQCGIPPRHLIDLPLQPLYDLFRSLASDENRASLDHLVIVDDETADLLKDLMRRTVERLRPENRGVAHNVAIEARSIASEKAGGDVPADMPLTELEKRLWLATGEAGVVLEDNDFAAYGEEMNRIISTRPHGRSRRLD